MEQNKVQFIFDNYIEVEIKDLHKVTRWLTVGSITHTVEPWPEDQWRVYVKKDAADILKLMEEELNKK